MARSRSIGSHRATFSTASEHVCSLVLPRRAVRRLFVYRVGVGRHSASQQRHLAFTGDRLEPLKQVGGDLAELEEHILSEALD